MNNKWTENLMESIDVGKVVEEGSILVGGFDKVEKNYTALLNSMESIIRQADMNGLTNKDAGYAELDKAIEILYKQVGKRITNAKKKLK